MNNYQVMKNRWLEIYFTPIYRDKKFHPFQGLTAIHLRCNLKASLTLKHYYYEKKDFKFRNSIKQRRSKEN